ncbi:MAG TPA: twin-arginine translocase TatA/TatE family subunit [Acidimicrobiales bacterium]|nr:twin-arginine translocase TatA/TatE family subunit [Acidimicrobiales bacterium]
MLAEIFGMDGIIVLIVVLALLFGGAAIPKLARSLGSAHNEFKKGLSEGAAESADGSAAEPAAAPAQPATTPAKPPAGVDPG